MKGIGTAEVWRRGIRLKYKTDKTMINTAYSKLNFPSIELSFMPDDLSYDTCTWSDIKKRTQEVNDGFWISMEKQAEKVSMKLSTVTYCQGNLVN